MTEKKGLLLVYTGNGKGKTTAALGLVFRALGRDKRVAIVQFIKGKWKTGERLFAERLPDLQFFTMGRGFTWESENLELDADAARAAWSKARELIEGGDRDLVVLDEITYAISYGFVGGADVLTTLRNRPAHVSVVVTGRDAPQEIVQLADLVTEMREIKHPFAQGIPAQIGIDF